MELEKEIGLVKTYCPHIYFDKNEPFFPIRVGYTVFESSIKSPSFPREIKFSNIDIEYVLEYAIYWDFDIQHLYDLEHIWVYIDRKGKVVDAEGSFHGKYLKVLLEDRSNIEEETHIRVYSQPGKHAFSPIPELFKLIPDLKSACGEGVGEDGLIVTNVGRNRYNTSDKINSAVKKYMQRYKFMPSLEFEYYRIPENIIVTWEELYNEIPNLVYKKLKDIYCIMGKEIYY